MGGCTSQNVPLEAGVLPNNLAEPTIGLDQNSEIKAGAPVEILHVASGNQCGPVEPVAAAISEPVAAVAHMASGVVVGAQKIAEPIANGVSNVVHNLTHPTVVEADPIPNLQNELGFAAVDANDPEAVAAMVKQVEDFNRKAEQRVQEKALANIAAEGGDNVVVIKEDGQALPLAVEPVGYPAQPEPLPTHDPEAPVETVQELAVTDAVQATEPHAVEEAVVEEAKDVETSPTKKKKWRLF